MFPGRRFEVLGFRDSGFIGIKGFRVEIFSALGLEDSGPGGGGGSGGGWVSSGFGCWTFWIEASRLKAQLAVVVWGLRFGVLGG